MRIEYEPREPGQSGCVSFTGWHNADLHAALRRFFNESPRERIVRLDVTRDGLKAYFEATNCPRLPEAEVRP